MFGSLVQKLQSLSPLASPTTSPSTSPKLRRKLGFGKSRKRKESGFSREDLREVQSEPELEYDAPSKDRRKISAPAHTGGGSKGNGRVRTAVDEPYPAHQDFENIYDVPARLRRKVDTPTPANRRVEGSRTVGRMEGLKQVRGPFDQTRQVEVMGQVEDGRGVLKADTCHMQRPRGNDLNKASAHVLHFFELMCGEESKMTDS